jgi:hypothetical protein
MGLRELNLLRVKLGKPPIARRTARAAPVSTVALRVRKHRARRAAGRLSLTLDVDEVSTIEVLCAARLLDRQRDHTRTDVAHAVEELLAILARDL